MSNDQEWARQHPELAAQLQKITADAAANAAPDSRPTADDLDARLGAIHGELMETGGTTVGWFVLVVLLVRAIADWGWSPWWLCAVAFAVVAGIRGALSIEALLRGRRRIQLALMAVPVARHAKRADELAAVLEAALEREQARDGDPDTVRALQTVAQALGEQCGALDEVADQLAGRCR